MKFRQHAVFSQVTIYLTEDLLFQNLEKRKKPSSFLNLEKRNYEKKIITQLKISGDEIISDIKQINKETKKYYKAFLSFLAFLYRLKGFKENKTPGEDGFTKEFYETFFFLISDRHLDSYKEAFGKGKLSISQRRGIISLIPKDESYLVELTNWRPITLLNVDYKILARAIAKRIKPKLSKLIHSDQTGFVKGRFIGPNVRHLNDIMEYTEINKIPLIMVLIDFEKAYDTLEWQFIHNTLKFLTFGPSIRNWISVLYTDIDSGIITGGYCTKCA